MVDPNDNFYKINTNYSVTLNPVDKYQFFGRIDRYQKFHTFMYDNFLSFVGKYELFIEISEPRGMKIQGYGGPRLHLHGTISFKSKKQIKWFLLYGYYKILRYSSFDIDTIDDLTKWRIYCTKQTILKHNRIASHCCMNS